MSFMGRQTHRGGLRVPHPNRNPTSTLQSSRVLSRVIPFVISLKITHRHRTSGMSSTAIHKHKSSSYDPRRQWGLKPDPPHPAEGGAATYHFSGHIAQTGAWASEQIGREGQAKAQRKQAARDSDRALRALLKHDKQGMKAVMMAREAAAAAATSDKTKKRKSEAKEEPVKQGYSAKVIQDLGFDPAAMKPGSSGPSGPSREAATKKKVRYCGECKPRLTVLYRWKPWQLYMQTGAKSILVQDQDPKFVQGFRYRSRRDPRKLKW